LDRLERHEQTNSLTARRVAFEATRVENEQAHTNRGNEKRDEEGTTIHGESAYPPFPRCGRRREIARSCMVFAGSWEESCGFSSQAARASSARISASASFAMETTSSRSTIFRAGRARTLPQPNEPAWRENRGFPSCSTMCAHPSR